MPRLTCTKRYSDIPFAHRQHLHDGHCAYIHGHNWTFEFTFAASRVDENGFVVDFGKLKWLKDWINSVFDHALILNEGDPYLQYLTKSLTKWGDIEHKEIMPSYTGDFAKIGVVADASCEGLAKFLHAFVTPRLDDETFGRVYVYKVKVEEDSKNSAEYAVL